MTANELRIEEKNYGALVLACETYRIFKQAEKSIDEKRLLSMLKSALIGYLHTAIKYKITNASKSKDAIEKANEYVRDLLKPREKMRIMLLIWVVKIKYIFWNF